MTSSTHFRRILAATDLSETSLSAVREAVALTPEDGVLAVCHVIPASLDAVQSTAQHSSTGVLELEAKLRTALADRLERIVGERSITLFIEHGEAYAEIIHRAEEFAADLVVIGSRGHSGLERLMLGSVAERVVRYAHGPVLVVRETETRGVVLAATDFSDPALPAIQAAAREAERRNARLVVLHVVDQSLEAYAAAAGGLFGAIGALPPPSLQEERRLALLATLSDALKRDNISGEPRVIQGTPAGSIVDTARELGAELVVVGTHGRTGLARITLGSVAERVARNAHCSVLAVRMHS